MLKKILVLTIMILLPFSFAGWTKEAKTKGTLSVSKMSDGYTLSIDAVDVMAADILKDLEKKCNVKILTQGKPLPSIPVSIRCNDMALKEAIKKLMKVSGVKNHLINHKVDDNKQEIIEIHILSYSGKLPANTVKTTPPVEVKETKKASSTVKPAAPPDDFNEKVEWFKENYQWENEETMDLAGHLLEAMPDQIKQPGMEELVKILDEKIRDENINSVNEETLIQAIEGTVPPKIAPVMSKHMKQYIQQFKGEDDAQPGKTASEVYQDFFTNKNKQ